MKTICEQFPITDSEWSELDKQFGDLAHYAAWELLRKNTKNNHTDEVEDIAQDLRWAIYRAGCYYKRQIYIESCFRAVRDHMPEDPVMCATMRELEDLWENRTRHGAGRVKYGDHQQEVLEKLVDRYVPEDQRPNKNQPLNIDFKFIRYCKAITWNAQKSMGKKITREKSWRTGLVSLSEHDHLGAVI